MMNPISIQQVVDAQHVPPPDQQLPYPAALQRVAPPVAPALLQPRRPGAVGPLRDNWALRIRDPRQGAVT